jgi:signal peptidase II
MQTEIVFRRNPVTMLEIMAAAQTIFQKSNRRIAVLALVILALDQFTKWLVLQTLDIGDEKILIPGFFKFVHWVNTGAAWSRFSGYNNALAFVAFIALIVLAVMCFTRHHTLASQIAFGLIVGGIAGNLTDRLLPSRHAVVDFIYFYIQQRNGNEIGFPAFNIADSAICTGVGLIFLITWKNEHAPKSAESSK